MMLNVAGDVLMVSFSAILSPTSCHGRDLEFN